MSHTFTSARINASMFVRPCPVLLSGFNKTAKCRQILVKFPCVRLHEHASNSSRVISCVQTDRQTKGAILLGAMQESKEA
jgi:hypothetical protein